jgi:quercetin dioxygenase-like cupin family protein
MFRLLAPIAVATSLYVQTAASPTVVPISKEGHHHLVLDNEYVRVYSVEVAPHAETLYHQHDLDYIFVTLGDSDVDSVRVGEKPVHLLLKDGEARFTKGGFAHKAVNNSDKPFKNVTIEIVDPNLSTDKSCGCSAALEKCPCGGNGSAFHGPRIFGGGWWQGRTHVTHYNLTPDDRSKGDQYDEAIRGEGLLVAVTSFRVKDGADDVVLKPGDTLWFKKGSSWKTLSNAHDLVKFVVISFPFD